MTTRNPLPPALSHLAQMRGPETDAAAWERGYVEGLAAGRRDMTQDVLLSASTMTREMLIAWLTAAASDRPEPPTTSDPACERCGTPAPELHQIGGAFVCPACSQPDPNANALQRLMDRERQSTIGYGARVSVGGRDG